MISINANRSDAFSRSLTGGYKGYDELGVEAYLRYYLNGAGGVLASVASTTTQPASAGKYITIRGVDFAGAISGFPTFPNGNSTIIDQAISNATKGISVTGTTSTLTAQKYIQNYLFPKKLTVDSLDFIEYNIPIIFATTTNNATFNNIVANIRLKKVNSAGTITTIATITPTIPNKSLTNTSSTENLNNKFTSITGLNDQDILYIELEVTCDITCINTGVVATSSVLHASNAQSYLTISV